ncbi:hypothetical protein [Iodobacter sp.]|uniref:hypothetical protein n=1 Tax=Iodobacter sp. TaxID=1915058 RepID=UPI0025E6D7DD|nr:hypothetical protein [Iodobacter sp.]
MIKNKYSINELLGLSLRCLPATRQGIHLKSEREHWPYVEVPGKGGPGGVRREFEVPSYVLNEITEILTDLSNETERRVAQAPKNVIHIHKGQVMDDTRLLALCASATDKMNETHKLGMTSENKGELIAILYKFMMLKRGQSEVEAADDIEQFLNVFKK